MAFSISGISQDKKKPLQYNYNNKNVSCTPLGFTRQLNSPLSLTPQFVYEGSYHRSLIFKSASTSDKLRIQIHYPTLKIKLILYCKSIERTSSSAHRFVRTMQSLRFGVFFVLQTLISLRAYIYAISVSPLTYVFMFPLWSSFKYSFNCILYCLAYFIFSSGQLTTKQIAQYDIIYNNK